MRSYLEIMIDVKEGKKVDYEELRVALLFCRDLLFFTESDLEKALSCNNELQRKLMKGGIEGRFQAKKNPIEKWWKGNIPQIKNRGEKNGR